MFITPAFAAAGDPTSSLIQNMVPLVLLFVVFYIFLIRPQQQKMKKHQEMLAAIRRGDTIVTAGGVIGKVTRIIDDSEVRVEIADGMNVRVVRGMIAEVRTKGEPVKDEK